MRFRKKPKGSSCCTECDEFEARVRTQVAEDVSRALRVEGVDVTDWQRGYRACAERAMAVLGLGREHAGKGFPSTPAAQPDVVGTPDLKEG